MLFDPPIKYNKQWTMKIDADRTLDICEHSRISFKDRNSNYNMDKLLSANARIGDNGILL